MSILRASEIYASLFCRLLEHGIPNKDAARLVIYMSLHRPTALLIRQRKEKIIEVLARDVATAYNRVKDLLDDIEVVPLDIVFAGINTYREHRQPIGY